MKTYGDLILDCISDLEARSGVPDLKDFYLRMDKPLPEEILAIELTDEQYNHMRSEITTDTNPVLAPLLRQAYLLSKASNN